MKQLIVLFSFALSFSVWAQEASVSVKLKPAGSFVGKSTDVKGTAVQKGDEVEASNIVVVLTNITTGIKLRDEHTRKHLEVEKFPEAVLVSAKGKGGKGEGILRIRGIEKPVSGTYKIEGGKLMAEFPIKFSDYGITGIKYMGIGVDDNGRINATVPLAQSGTSAPGGGPAPGGPAGKPAAPAPKKK